MSPLLALSGASSWAAFAKSAECVGISEEGGRVTVVPTRNLGPREGFKPSANLVFATLDDLTQLGALTAEVLRAAR